MVKTIAEIGINHNGSLNMAKKLIDVAASAGCDFVKFQKRDIESVYTKEELNVHRESPWGKTNREQKLGLEFNVDQYHEIDAHCKVRGIGWFVSCWDLKSVDLMEANFPDMPFHKVASAMACDRSFLEKLNKTKRPVILSTGMMSEHQIVDAVKVLGNLAVLMQCTSTYPTKPEEMNLSYITKLSHFVDDKCKIGFSNHYSGILWAPLAVTLGAEYLEFHITLDRTLYGSDQAASLEPDGIEKLIEHVNVASKMLGDGTKRVYASEEPIIKKLRRTTDF